MCPPPPPADNGFPPSFPVPSAWVLVYQVPYRSWRQLRVHAGTDKGAHMFMAWDHYKPRKKMIFKVVRGVIVNCGWVWCWNNPSILEQWEHGDTVYHTFRIAVLQPSDHVWFYLFTPLGPYDLQCQGPLTYVPPPETLPWAQFLYVGTKAKGIYFTNTFSGPGDIMPYWWPKNDGLTDLRVWQLCPDPCDGAAQHYAIVGPSTARVLYRRRPLVSQAWEPVLTHSDALDLTHATGGEMCWVACNWNRPGCVYVLFNTDVTDNGTWCLRSANDGATWTASQIYAGLANNAAGNLSVGTLQGESPFHPGDVIYAALNTGFGGQTSLFTSTDNGFSWNIADTIGLSVYKPRCTVDPTDQATVYVGAFGGAAVPAELCRSLDHGLNLVPIDGVHHLGTFIDYAKGVQWIHATAGEVSKVLCRGHVWQTWDHADTWQDMGPTQVLVQHLSILSVRPDYLYLARDVSAPLSPNPFPDHVIYVTDDDGATMEGKSGDHADQSDGRGDSIPFDCGGVCHDGIMQVI